MKKKTRRKRTIRRLLLATVCAVVATGAVIGVLRLGSSEPRVPLLPVFVRHGETQIEVNLSALPRSTWRVAYQGPAMSPGDENWKESHAYSGVRLADVLESIGPLSEGDTISAVAGDGWSKALPASVLSGDTAVGEIMLAVSREEEGTDSWGDAPTLVFAPPDEMISNRDMLSAFGPDLAHYHGDKPSTTGFLVKNVMYLIVNFDGQFPGLPTSASADETTFEPTEGVVLTLAKGSWQVEYTLADLEMLETLTAPGTFTNSAGVDYSATYTGVPLMTLIGNAPTDGTLRVTASDGYSMNYAVDMIADDSEGVWVLAYKENGEWMPEDPGPLRIVQIGESNPHFTSSLSARMVERIELHGTYEAYTLRVTGAVERVFSREELEAGIGCPCHTATVTATSKGETSTYTGLPLWRLVGYVDDEIFAADEEGIYYNEEDFSDDLAAMAYTVTLVAEDGYDQTVTSDLIARDDRFIVAFKKDGVFLDPSSNGYMQFTFDDSLDLPEDLRLKPVKFLVEIRVDL